jgi:WD40 repeat protein
MLSFSKAIVKSTDVNIIRSNGETSRVAVQKCKILTQVKFVEIGRSSALCSLSDQGLQVWSAEGDLLIFNYGIGSAVPEGEEPRFLRGVASTGRDLVVGGSNGNVLVFDCSSGTKGGDFPLVHTLETNKYPIQAIAASSISHLVAVGDDYGNIFVYNSNEAFAQCSVFHGTGAPCTSLAVAEEGVIVAGYSTGHIRLFRTDVNELAAEISAHTRAVTGLAYQDNTQLLASCSGDSRVYVWSIPTFKSKSNSTVGCVFSDLLENKMCTGIAFVGETRLAVTSYDDEELCFYSRV